MKFYLLKAVQLNGKVKNMFDKFKDMAKLKKLQDEVKSQKFTAEKDGVKIVINGSFQVEEVVLNPDLDNNTQASLVKDLVNDANKSAQQAMASKLQGMM